MHWSDFRGPHHLLGEATPNSGESSNYTALLAFSATPNKNSPRAPLCQSVPCVFIHIIAGRGRMTNEIRQNEAAALPRAARKSRKMQPDELRLRLYRRGDSAPCTTCNFYRPHFRAPLFRPNHRLQSRHAPPRFINIAAIDRSSAARAGPAGWRSFMKISGWPRAD